MIDMIHLYYVLRASTISLILKFIELRRGAYKTSEDISLAERFPLQAHLVFLFCEDKESLIST